MLATLNLQLSPVDLLDDTLSNSATLVPGAEGEATSGFAHLLRLRVDTALQPTLASGQLALPEGEILPPGGNPLPQTDALPALVGSEPPTSASLLAAGPVGEQQRPAELPAPAEPVESQAVQGQLSTPLLAPAPAAELDGDTELPAEIPDISLDSPVIYPPQREVPALETDSADLPAPLTVATPVQFQPPVVEVRADELEGRGEPRSRPFPPGVPQLTRSELATRTQEFVAATGGSEDTRPIGTGFRELGQRLFPEARPLPAVPVPLLTETAEEVIRTELVQRPDLVAPQRTNNVRDVVTEFMQLRGEAPQQLHAPQTQAASQPAQSVLTAAPVTPLTNEAGYAAIAQRSTDLIGTPVRDAAWGEQIGERVLLMAGRNLNSAEIRLTPAELGPVRVRVSVDDGAANVTFHAHHAVTREAIEQAIPRLREMLAENGLTLGQADVGEQGVAQRDRDNAANGRLSQEANDETQDLATDDELHPAPSSITQNGLVDTFA